MIDPRIKQNRFESFDEVAQGFTDLMEPLKPFFSDSHLGHLHLGSHGTVYSEDTQEVEAFLRPLWGLGPFITQQDSPFLETYLKGIAAGTDPQHPDYWGQTTDYDQLLVEMASLSTFLLLNKEKTWDSLTRLQQKKLHAWLIQINQHEIPANNWHFFRILVNAAMKHCHQSYSQAMIDEDWALINSFYIGKGWYCDGVSTQIDYYVSFAIHYYSLLYCRFMPEDNQRTTIMKERATEFAQTFKYWFAENGEALPFGRSLTYRFSQAAFFSALVFADVEALPWGEIKGLISRHLHHWMNQDIFTTDGLLSVGYHYTNLVFAEGYNGPGSPYWACKTFILLAVPQDHPYWKADVLPLQIPKSKLALPESRGFYHYNQDRTHLQMFPAGQFVNYQSHASAKYSKFVYSTHFGFSVPKSNYWYYEGAYDNCLALAEGDREFRTKPMDAAYEILEDRVIHQWQPWEDVTITSTIMPLNGCHVRIHEIHTQRELTVYDGGFSTPVEAANQTDIQAGSARVVNSIGCSAIEGIVGFTEANVVRTEPNTNLFYPLTVLPHVKATLGKGAHVLVSLIAGQLPQEELQRPDIKINNQEIIVVQGEQHLRAALEM